MKFTVRDCDPDTGVPAEEGYDDEYVVSLPGTEIHSHPRTTQWPLPAENILLAAPDMNLRAFILKHVTTEEDLGQSSSVTGVYLAKENSDLPLSDWLKQNSLC